MCHAGLGMTGHSAPTLASALANNRGRWSCFLPLCLLFGLENHSPWLTPLVLLRVGLGLAKVPAVILLARAWPGVCSL